MAEAARMQGILGCCLRDYALDHELSPRQWQVCSHIQACQTEALGGLALHCGYELEYYHTCRDRMVSALRAAQHAGEPNRITRPSEIDRVLDELVRTDWVVYAKACLSYTDSVVAHLARYSHRIAIRHTRIAGLEADGSVAFHYHDYRHGRRHRLMRLEAGEFIRRFLLHVLPKGSCASATTAFSPTAAGGRNSPRSARRSVKRNRRPPLRSSISLMRTVARSTTIPARVAMSKQCV